MSEMLEAKLLAPVNPVFDYTPITNEEYFRSFRMAMDKRRYQGAPREEGDGPYIFNEEKRNANPNNPYYWRRKRK